LASVDSVRNTVKHSQLLIYALCTQTESCLNEVSARFEVEHTYTDYRELLKISEVEVVNVVTMWDQHTDPVLAALAAGKHVFLKKPMASTINDCRAIVTASEKAKGFLMAGHIFRFNPRYAAAKQENESGKIGKILSLYARRNIPASVTDDILNKIGPIIGDGVHDMDLMLWHTGASVETAYAQTTRMRDRKYPDLGWTMYRFDSGATGVLENAWCLPEKTPFQIDERMEIIGTKGSLHIQETHPNYSVCDENGWRSSRHNLLASMARNPPRSTSRRTRVFRQLYSREA
jgi:UDP-N-acetylglucosamine 3-dehydrogenase